MPLPPQDDMIVQGDAQPLARFGHRARDFDIGATGRWIA